MGAVNHRVIIRRVVAALSKGAQVNRKVRRLRDCDMNHNAEGTQSGS